MPPKPIVQRIAELEARKQALQARLGKQERARDTRRRVVLGSFILHQLEFNADGEQGASLREWLRRDLPSFLTRYGDKKLFADILPQPNPSTHKEEER
ncbi:MAG: mobilization protein [Pseudorhizobium sp.]